MKKHTIKTTIITLLAAGSLFAVACGGESKSETALPDTSTMTAAEAISVAATVQAQMEAAKDAPLAKGQIDPCTLLSKSEVEPVAGETMKDGEDSPVPSNPMGLKVCVFSAQSDRSGRMVQVSLVRNEAMDDKARKNGLSAAKLHTEEKKVYTDATPLAGLGDDAFRVGEQVKVLKGNSQISIMVTGKAIGVPAKAVSDDEMRALATAALKRLG